MNQLIEDQRQLLVNNYHSTVDLKLRAQDQIDAATDLKYNVIQKQVDAAWDQLVKFNNNHPPEAA